MEDLQQLGDRSPGRRKTDSEVPFQSCPRFDMHEFTEEQMDLIADKVATRVRNQFYTGVGEVVVGKILWIVGAVTVGIYVLFVKVGILKIPGG
jgi:hypothetical protein